MPLYDKDPTSGSLSLEKMQGPHTSQRIRSMFGIAYFLKREKNLPREFVKIS